MSVLGDCLSIVVKCVIFCSRLDALDSNAYQAFQASRNLRDVVDRVQELRRDPTKLGLGKKLSVRASLMTPILPMLVSLLKSPLAML